MDSGGCYEHLGCWGELAFTNSLEVLSPCAAPLPSGRAEEEISPKARPPFPHPGHDPPPWTRQKCLHMDLLRRDLPPLQGGFPKRRARRAGTAPRLNSGWRMVRHLPGLRDDSQVSWKVTETFIIWWAQEGGLFSPEPGIPSSLWFADPACNVPQREIHHRYCARSLVAYNTIIPTQVFFPERLILSLNTSF